MTLRDDSPTCSALLKRLRSDGDEAAWREFLDLYRPLLLAWCRHQGYQRADTEDLVSEVLIRLIRFLPHFNYDRTKGHFRGWLRQVFRNVAHDYWRQRGLPPGTVALPPDLVEPPRADDLADALDPHRRRAEQVFAEVRRITSAPSWEVWERTCRGETAREVGAALSMSVGAVRMRLKRVREQFKEVWDRLSVEEEKGGR